MYYYFARHVPTKSINTSGTFGDGVGVFYLTAIKWECIFTVKDNIVLADNALYTHHENKSQIFLHRVLAEDYDLLDAFSVSSMGREQFDAQYSPTRPQLIEHPNGTRKRLSKRA